MSPFTSMPTPAEYMLETVVLPKLFVVDILIKHIHKNYIYIPIGVLSFPLFLYYT